MEQNYVCKFCEKSFTTRRSCRRHENSLHKSNESVRKKMMMCSECFTAFQTKDRYDYHLADVHPEIKINVEKLQFGSFHELKEWQNKISKDTSSKFLKRKKYKTLSGEVCIYDCHRSGQFISKSTGKRHIKIGGSLKTGFFCPARMKTVVNEKSEQPTIDVTFFSTHVGHQGEVRRVPLTRKERDTINGKLTVSKTKRMALTEKRKEQEKAAKGRELSKHKTSNIRETIKVDISAILALIEEQDSDSELIKISHDVKELKHKLEARKSSYQLPLVVKENAPNKNIMHQNRSFPQKKEAKLVHKQIKDSSLENIRIG